jgi:uncharacterized protein
MKLSGVSIMLKRSSPSVKITFANREQILRALESLVKTWVKKYPEIEKIILFGSYARGDYFPGSDVDVLIIITESNKRALERIPSFYPSSFPCDIDIFPYTKKEIERLMKDPHGLVHRALSEGRQLYP